MARENKNQKAECGIAGIGIKRQLPSHILQREGSFGPLWVFSQMEPPIRVPVSQGKGTANPCNCLSEKEGTANPCTCLSDKKGTANPCTCLSDKGNHLSVYPSLRQRELRILVSQTKREPPIQHEVVSQTKDVTERRTQVTLVTGLHH